MRLADYEALDANRCERDLIMVESQEFFVDQLFRKQVVYEATTTALARIQADITTRRMVVLLHGTSIGFGAGKKRGMGDKHQANSAIQSLKVRESIAPELSMKSCVIGRRSVGFRTP